MAAPMNPLDRNPAAEEFAVIKQRLSNVSAHFLNWNNNVSLEFNIPLAHFVRSLRIIISSIDDEVARDAISILGIRNLFFPTVRRARPRELYNFCEWLRTSRGNQEFTALQRRLKMRRRAEPGRAVGDSALISAFQQQTADQAAALKEVRLEADMEIAELRRRINEVIVRRDADLENLRRTFLPASEYVPLAEAAFNEACWKMYVQECLRIGAQAEVKTELWLQKGMDVYGNRVRDTHLYEFVSQPVRRGQLVKYINEKIAGFIMAHDLSQATHFRRLLETAVAQEAAGAEENAGADTDGEGAEAGDGEAATVAESGESSHHGGGTGLHTRGGTSAVRRSERRGHP